ncbi:MAG: hypothetical protein V3U76_01590 [Granulosicoccus sp.]
MKHTLGTAARATGVSKSTIYRAVKSGKLSAKRNDDGEYAIDPAELHRVYPPVAQCAETADLERHATPKKTGTDDKVMPPDENFTHWLRDLVDEQRRQIQEKDDVIKDQMHMMEERDAAWRKRLESLELKLLPAPETEPESTKGFWSKVFG